MISPLLANVYLHEVLDVWFEQEVKPRLTGRAFLIRYADDFVIAFSLESDARRVMEVLPKRFGRYGLTLHPEKTRLVPFRRPRDNDPGSGPGTFDLLGFTHHWGRSFRGNWVVRRRTSRKRFSRSIRSIDRWCRANRRWLDRRSSRSHMDWERFRKLLARYPLPRPRIVHRYAANAVV